MDEVTVPRVGRLGLALVAALSLPALAASASANYRTVIEDCAADGRLDGAYSRRDLRTALNRLPSDIRKYTDCAEVIRAALAHSRAGAPGGWHEANYNCHPRRARTIKDNGVVRVYSVPAPHLTRDVYACLYANGKRRFLGIVWGDTGDGAVVSPVRLRGRLVGWIASGYDHYGQSSYRITVQDVRSGRILHSAEQSDLGWSSETFVMDRAGSIAWTSEGYDLDGNYHQVFKSDTSRHAELLDSDLSIDPRSLRRHGKVISWRHGHSARTARFVR